MRSNGSNSGGLWMSVGRFGTSQRLRCFLLFRGSSSWVCILGKESDLSFALAIRIRQGLILKYNRIRDPPLCASGVFQPGSHSDGLVGAAV